MKTLVLNVSTYFSKNSKNYRSDEILKITVLTFSQTQYQYNTISQYHNFTILLFHNLTILHFVTISLLQSCNLQLAILQYYNLKILQSYNLTSLESYNHTILQLYNLTIIQLQSYNLTILQSYSLTIHRFYKIVTYFQTWLLTYKVDTRDPIGSKKYLDNWAKVFCLLTLWYSGFWWNICVHITTHSSIGMDIWICRDIYYLYI